MSIAHHHNLLSFLHGLCLHHGATSFPVVNQHFDTKAFKISKQITVAHTFRQTSVPLITEVFLALDFYSISVSLEKFWESLIVIKFPELIRLPIYTYVCSIISQRYNELIKPMMRALLLTWITAPLCSSFFRFRDIR